MITNVERKRQKENETDTNFLKRINKKNISKKTKKIIPSVNPIVNLIVNPIVIQDTEPLIESEIIYKTNEKEETKTTTNPMKKTKLTHIESRKQKDGESNTEYEKRIKQLDNAKLNRTEINKQRAELSKKIEADYNKRLAALNQDSKKASIDKYHLAGTKTPN